MHDYEYHLVEEVRAGRLTRHIRPDDSARA